MVIFCVLVLFCTTFISHTVSKGAQGRLGASAGKEEGQGGAGRQRPGLAFISIALLKYNPYPLTGRV